MVWYSSLSEVLLHSVVDWDPFYSQLTTLTRREERGRGRGREGKREGGGGRKGGREGREGRREEENEVGRKDGEKKRRDRVIVRQRNNMRCIPTTNRECIRCQYHYTKQTLTMATVPSLVDWNVYMIPMFTQKGCT